MCECEVWNVRDSILASSHGIPSKTQKSPNKKKSMHSKAIGQCRTKEEQAHSRTKLLKRQTHRPRKRLVYALRGIMLDLGSGAFAIPSSNSGRVNRGLRYVYPMKAPFFRISRTVRPTCGSRSSLSRGLFFSFLRRLILPAALQACSRFGLARSKTSGLDDSSAGDWATSMAPVA